MSEFRKVVHVEWVDSSMLHEQSDDLPTPTRIISVGWLAKEDEEYIVVVRDWHQDPQSYKWRGACAIPRRSIISSSEVEIL